MVLGHFQSAFLVLNGVISSVCVCACVRACVRACVCVCEGVKRGGGCRSYWDILRQH